ncbi:Fur family transcriptional regulator [Motiliproteus sp. SC1-56]|uniref:Fur family transcriptional regulator n=1 Tax=Motiliproteus sp. SC1-56 TaxID=2799565 RepID=UPI001A8D2E06|nr:Fur family transcriptional regulator [Motiliproteus sp. SC1-56]
MCTPPPDEAFSNTHDHQHCIDSAVTIAVALCKSRGCRLTPVRKRVLELVWQSHKPLGAYQLLAMLAHEGFSPAPPTVYRALDFLLEQGLIHRLASLNAFIGCRDPRHNHHGYFLICRICGCALELESERLAGVLQHSADARGFALESETVELFGRCPPCQENPA